MFSNWVISLGKWRCCALFVLKQPFKGNTIYQKGFVDVFINIRANPEPMNEPTPRVQRHNVDKATKCFILLELLRQYVDKWKNKMNNVIICWQDGQCYKVEACIVFGDWGRARRPARKVPGDNDNIVVDRCICGLMWRTPPSKRGRTDDI